MYKETVHGTFRLRENIQGRTNLEEVTAEGVVQPTGQQRNRLDGPGWRWSGAAGPAGSNPLRDRWVSRQSALPPWLGHAAGGYKAFNVWGPQGGRNGAKSRYCTSLRTSEGADCAGTLTSVFRGCRKVITSLRLQVAEGQRFGLWLGGLPCIVLPLYCLPRPSQKFQEVSSLNCWWYRPSKTIYRESLAWCSL